MLSDKILKLQYADLNMAVAGEHNKSGVPKEYEI